MSYVLPNLRSAAMPKRSHRPQPPQIPPAADIARLFPMAGLLIWREIIYFVKLRKYFFDSPGASKKNVYRTNRF